MKTPAIADTSSMELFKVGLSQGQMLAKPNKPTRINQTNGENSIERKILFDTGLRLCLIERERESAETETKSVPLTINNC